MNVDIKNYVCVRKAKKNRWKKCLFFIYKRLREFMNNNPLTWVEEINPNYGHLKLNIIS